MRLRRPATVGLLYPSEPFWPCSAISLRLREWRRRRAMRRRIKREVESARRDIEALFRAAEGDATAQLDALERVFLKRERGDPDA